MTTSSAMRTPARGEERIGSDAVVELVTRAYWMELETAANYLAASVNLDGVRAAEVAEALADDVAEEFEHARRLARRLSELGGIVPGSLSFTPEQHSLQPLADQTDVVRVIEGVLEAEEAAIDGYRDLIEQCDGIDWVTQDLAIELLGDEEAHRRRFQGYLREYRP
ncbi:MAG TPA: ferritin-like domain-containing protein [Gaiellaceae bacterium]|nr:ferritin-like domain-containing protein [Gaiellaceae bacterium]